MPGSKAYSKEAQDAHVLRMNSETASNVSDSIAKVGNLIATEGIGIALGALLLRITGDIRTVDTSVVPARKNPLAQLREDFIVSLDRLMSMLNVKIPLIDVQPMGWLRPLLAYYKTLLETKETRTPEQGGGTWYVALPLAERAEFVLLFPAVARTSIHLFSALLGRA